MLDRQHIVAKRAGVAGAVMIAGVVMTGCGVRAFRVVPGNPDYLLRTPEAQRTPFADVLRAYNGFEPGQGWVDLRPLMELRIENAYYEKGASRRGLAGFLGTEVARYEVVTNGLRLLNFQSMKNRPEADAPVQKLIAENQEHFEHYRLYYEVVFKRNDNAHGSVLLGADTEAELGRLAEELENPEQVCNASSTHCAVFPEACSVSVEMKVVVNGKAESVVWTSQLRSLFKGATPQHVEMKRLFRGKETRVEIKPTDAGALRLPLLPGDEISWH